MGCGVQSKQQTQQITNEPTKINKNSQEAQQNINQNNSNYNNNNQQNNEIISLEPQPEFTYYVYQLIYQIPNAFVYQIITNGGYELVAYGNLDIMEYKNQQDGSYSLLLQVNTNFFYFLNKSIGILESPENDDMFYLRRHFIFPGIDCNYDICVMNIQYIEMIQYLEAILAENSNLFIPEVQIQKLPPSNQPEFEQQQYEQNEDINQVQQPQKKFNFISGVLNKGSELIKQGGELLRQGIKATSNFICYSIKKTGDFLRKKLPKSSNEFKIDPQIMNIVNDAHKKKKEKFQLTAGIIAQVSKQAIEISKLFAKKAGIENNVTNNPAGALIQEAVGVYDGMLDAINIVEQNMICNVAELVEEKFGHDAGILVKQGLEIGMIQTDNKEIIKGEVVKAVNQEFKQ